MDKKIYTLTLDDGTEITDLRLNGNNFISDKEVTPDTFNGKLSTVAISDGEISETYHNMALVNITQYGEEYWFILREMSEQELQNLKNRADIDYIAMMADINI